QLPVLQFQLELIDLHLAPQQGRIWILLHNAVGGKQVQLCLKFFRGEVSGILIHGRLPLVLALILIPGVALDSSASTRKSFSTVLLAVQHSVFSNRSQNHLWLSARVSGAYLGTFFGQCHNAATPMPLTLLDNSAVYNQSGLGEESVTVHPLPVTHSVKGEKTGWKRLCLGRQPELGAGSSGRHRGLPLHTKTLIQLAPPELNSPTGHPWRSGRSTPWRPDSRSWHHWPPFQTPADPLPALLPAPPDAPW